MAPTSSNTVDKHLAIDNGNSELPKSAKPETEKGASKDAITQRNQLESPLLRLPGELRNRIYSYVLGNHIIDQYGLLEDGETYKEKCMCCTLAEYGRYSSSPPLYIKSLLTLPSTCKQLYTETHMLIFTLNILQLGHIVEFKEEVFDVLPERAKNAITRVRVDSGALYDLERCTYGAYMRFETPTMHREIYRHMLVELRGLKKMEVVPPRNYFEGLRLAAKYALDVHEHLELVYFAED
ncbi:hypothetical protein CC80DRAFT_571655 [Byssothecium circinans]|uniref:DUF7730 domain-containing protein n=1 Tax=Byssothecium circinans TaxID=147558 RepID=A0A6A5T9I2_9PLEO|nr:hypothetical protein CC80DRAFT_583377 [Byssothecium circinans]KAF1952808.1 hypothetical protein CC80DRAFT_571655 [Byssothecium circinans]